MEQPYILHMFTPGKQVSPFDVNMAADAGWQTLVPYCEVGVEAVTALTQDTIFSRGPKGAKRSAIFIGGRDVLVADEMQRRAKAAMFKPFVVHLLIDPSGAYTTAAAMVASVEAALQRGGHALARQRVLVVGGAGPVGRIVGVIAARSGAAVRLSSRAGLTVAEQAAAETGARFRCTLHGADGGAAHLRDALVQADVVLSCAAAGVQAVSAADLDSAPALKVAADINAVPPEGIAGVGVMDDAKPLAGTAALGIGALAIGNVKYQTQQRLLLRMREAEEALELGIDQAFETARAVLAEAAAAKRP